MLLEDYFDFQRPDDIRLKGTRVGIETVLYDFIFRARTPDEIVRSYPSLTLEQVYATILYYHHEKEKVTAYLTEWMEWSERMRREQAQDPTIVRLREAYKALKAEKKLLADVQG
ncbi:MAG: DUF433 domain-containing protein [Thermomicrobiales bacterium]